MQPLDLFVLKRRHRGCIYLCNHSNMNLLSGSNMKGVSIYEYFYWIQQRQTLYTLWQNLYRGWHRKRMELQKDCWRTWQEPFLYFQGSSTPSDLFPSLLRWPQPQENRVHYFSSCSKQGVCGNLSCSSLCSKVSKQEMRFFLSFF